MQLVRADIPASITTIEQLAAWCGVVLQAYNPGLKSKEAENYTDYTCQTSTFTDADQTERLVIRLNLRLVAAWRENGSKVWANTQEFSTATLATGFKS